jgi:hypothetical protein
MTVAGWDESARQRAGHCEQRETSKKSSALTIHYFLIMVAQ